MGEFLEFEEVVEVVFAEGEDDFDGTEVEAVAQEFVEGAAIAEGGVGEEKFLELVKNQDGQERRGGLLGELAQEGEGGRGGGGEVLDFGFWISADGG